jgi:glutathione reductase (NADPH)
MARTFDVIAIGTGSAASAVASHCRDAGWQVAIVDSRPFGGTCALRGCDPKKVLVGAAQAVDWTRRMKEFLQSVSIPTVYAAGDAAASGGPPLAPVASYEGQIVAANLLKGNHLRANYLGVPSVVFTIPQLAAVGLSERGAREQNLKFSVKKEMTSTWYSSRRVAETYSGYKVLVEEGTDRILGAHILGSEAGEVINLFALAIRSGMRATDLKHMLFAYPTSGSNMTRML